MRPQVEAAAGLGALALLSVLAAALGTRENRAAEADPRASAFVAGPLGSRGLAESLERLHVEVVRFRRSTRLLPRDSAGGRRSALLLLNPPERLSAGERDDVLAWQDAPDGGDLVLAGRATSRLMACFGYGVDWRGLDSLELKPAPGTGPWPRVNAVLASSGDTVVADSSRTEDATVTSCVVPPVARIDTLLATTSGRAVAVRLHRADRDRRVILLADVGLLRNRALRDTPAGPFALGLFAGRYDRVVFDEAHQGFGAGGSLAGATLDWSLRSPLGWAAWQLAVIGLLVLFAGAVRFGPPRTVVERRRRSPLEHVRALATALAAARGHDVAIAAIVLGLRRRLLPAGERPRGDWRPWVAQLAANVRTPRARAAARTLQSLTRPGQPAQSVLQAANAVEDVWQELRP
jgi:hypothetical protein